MSKYYIESSMPLHAEWRRFQRFNQDCPLINHLSDPQYYVITVICSNSASCSGKQTYNGCPTPVSPSHNGRQALYTSAYTILYNAQEVKQKSFISMRFYLPYRSPFGIKKRKLQVPKIWMLYVFFRIFVSMVIFVCFSPNLFVKPRFLLLF